MQIRNSVGRALLLAMIFASAGLHVSRAQVGSFPVFDGRFDPDAVGPYNGNFLPDGEGLEKKIDIADPGLTTASPWTLYCWIHPSEPLTHTALIAGIGDPNEEYPRYLIASDGRLALWLGGKNLLTSKSAQLTTNQWQLIAATFDGGSYHLYLNGVEVANGSYASGPASGTLKLAPAPPSWIGNKPTQSTPYQQMHYSGKIAQLVFLHRSLSAQEFLLGFKQHGDFSLIEFENGTKSWPKQSGGYIGATSPQDPSMLPHGKAPVGRPVALPLTPAGPALQSSGENQWTLADDWYLAPAPTVHADGGQISRTGFSNKGWWRATVPGTVLTTMVDRGVYPDPYYGLNEIAIPESLNKQDYWYRVEFDAPANFSQKQLALNFLGINYKAEVWLNGTRLGEVKGAFIRGVFDVSHAIHAGEANALAVKISPPPHPGFGEEQSIKAGPGTNGGVLAIDGPTFFASEGWDWMPAIRDRDSGIWQPVTITATDAVKIGDAQVITTLPLPDTNFADVAITVPVSNQSNAIVHGTLTAEFENVSVQKDVVLAPGDSDITFSPAEFAKLHVEHPRLWWPNGYGSPELYHLKLSFTQNGAISDVKHLRFGIREVTYELSVMDSSGHVRRIEYSPTTAYLHQQHVLDVSHEGIRSVPGADPPSQKPDDAGFIALKALASQAGISVAAPTKSEKDFWHSWVISFAPGGDTSPAIAASNHTGAAPYLVIKVNGVRIACRGGNWGLDDMMKRVSRSRLEPYFRLSREANTNMIRNWTGENEEEVFYDLADEYGMLVWNDFWESNQDHTLPAEDTDLFLRNARDTILRFRNHPSIVVWCGRNEGVPQPVLNEGLDALIRELDGTRYYSPGSNHIELQDSGPYSYTDARRYYTEINHGFSVETGTASIPTLETLQRYIPQADQWPINDVWAYHDFVPNKARPFLQAMQSEFGAATSLEDFERKAQMLNYTSHRAIFEGMDAHLWSPNSGRLLWMTQPAWPSTLWQIYSIDYDTQSSFYGVKKACEPQHVQLDLSNYNVDVINTTRDALAAVTVTADVYSLQNVLLQHSEKIISVAADNVTHVMQPDIKSLLASGNVVFVKLAMKSSDGKVLSMNLYWLGASDASYQQLNQLPAANLSIHAGSLRSTGEAKLRVHVSNAGNVAALQVKLVLQAADGSRILPAYYSDNYISLLPGEQQDIEIAYPAAPATAAPQLAIRGWNLQPQLVHVASESSQLH